MGKGPASCLTGRRSTNDTIIADAQRQSQVLALNEPAIVTSTYEVLEPETWIGKELPILEYIDIADQLKKGTWLILFYHHDCPDCRKEYPLSPKAVVGPPPIELTSTGRL